MSTDPRSLRSLPFLASASDALLTELAPRITEQKFKRGDTILAAGTYCDGAYFLADGVVEVRMPEAPADSTAGDKKVARVKGQPPGSPKPATGQLRAVDNLTVVLSGIAIAPNKGDRTFLEKGDIFGEMSALSRYAVASDVVAASDATCWLIGTAALRRMFDEPELAAFKSFFDARYRERALAAVIRRAGLFQDVSEQVLERLRARAELVSFKPNKVIVEQGTPADALYLIRGGYVKLSARTGGQDVAVTYLRKGDHTGEVSLLLGEPWPYSLTALEHVELIKIAKADFAEALSRHPAVADRLWRTAVARLKERGATVSKPVEQTHLQFAMDSGLIHGESVLLIDLSTCTRCDECVRACADTHGGTPRFVREGAKFRNYSIPSACYQCTDPVCMIGCPTNAITRPLGTLEVVINQDTCIGCGNCANRCPWSHIRMVPLSAPEPTRDKLATKCDLCVGRDDGPACVQMCPHGAAVRVDFKEFDRTRRRLFGEAR